VSAGNLISRKLAFVLLLWVSAFTFPWTIQALLCIVLVLTRFLFPAFHPASARSAKAFSRFTLYSIAVATFVILLNSLLIREGTITAMPLGIPLYEGGALFGARTAARLLLLSFSLLLFFVSTPLPEFIGYLQSMGLAPPLVLVLLLTLHFLDHLPGRIHQIFLAQQARGAPVDAGIVSRARALFSILSPLVLSSIVESIERGTALELRGFLRTDMAERTPAEDHTRPDWLTYTLIAVAVGLSLLKVVLWLIA
jgi:energy-coupling factor transport system permease protein